jgi:hypothetical protein
MADTAGPPCRPKHADSQHEPREPDSGEHLASTENSSKLGIDISETSVSKWCGGVSRRPRLGWTFLENHLKTMVSVDFFTVPTIQVLYAS